MQISKFPLWICALALSGGMTLHAQDTQAQAAARQALEQKMNELDASQPASPAAPAAEAVTPVAPAATASTVPPAAVAAPAAAAPAAETALIAPDMSPPYSQ